MTLVSELRSAFKESPDIGLVEERRTVDTSFALHDGAWDEPKFSNVRFYLAPKQGFHQLHRANCADLAAMFERLVRPFETMPDGEHYGLGRRQFVPAGFRQDGNAFVEVYRKHGLYFIGGFYATETVGIRTTSPHTLSYELLPECKAEFDEALWRGYERYGESTDVVRRDIRVHLFPSREFLERWDEVVTKEDCDVLEEIGLLAYPNYEIDVERYNRQFKAYLD